jgi:hypothetical protein
MNIHDEITAAVSAIKAAEEAGSFGLKVFKWVSEQFKDNCDTLARKLDEKFSEIHDIKGQIEEDCQELRQLKKDHRVAEQQTKATIKGIKLHKNIAQNIRRAHYLFKKKIPNAINKFEKITMTKLDVEEKEEMEPIQIYVDEESGINMGLLLKELKKPLSKFGVVYRFWENRCPLNSCLGNSHKAPHINNPSNDRYGHLIFVEKALSKTASSGTISSLEQKGILTPMKSTTTVQTSLSESTTTIQATLPETPTLDSTNDHCSIH